MKFKSLILCEQVRREDNGKLFFLGVYQENILAYKFPLNVELSFWVDAETTEKDNQLEFQLSVKPKTGGKKKIIANAQVARVLTDKDFIGSKARVNCLLERLNIKFEEESLLIISGRKKGGRFKIIDTREVIQHPDCPVDQQPS